MVKKNNNLIIIKIEINYDLWEEIISNLSIQDRHENVYTNTYRK